jgi:hypothetical protein
MCIAQHDLNDRVPKISRIAEQIEANERALQSVQESDFYSHFDQVIRIDDFLASSHMVRQHSDLCS